ncbi:hypothetical protein [Sphaerospermopsis reniformis]|uniref:hypothetical protein n=1 Tax=Sphaerospermopsis reniformis TaxID=531300 RepID=UPI0010F5C4FF|nr:hypothetical protein [Sphaerospermopsis reniformis]
MKILSRGLQGRNNQMLVARSSLYLYLQGAIAVESNPIDNSQLSEICFTLTLPQFSSATHSHSQQ